MFSRRRLVVKAFLSGATNPRAEEGGHVSNSIVVLKHGAGRKCQAHKDDFNKEPVSQLYEIHVIWDNRNMMSQLINLRGLAFQRPGHLQSYLSEKVITRDMIRLFEKNPGDKSSISLNNIIATA
jgi:hypothetical protein